MSPLFHFGRIMRTFAAIFLLLFPLVSDLMPKAQGGMSCCRTKKSCCCRRSMKSGEGKPAYQAPPACKRECAGMMAGSVKPAAPLRTAGIQSAPPAAEAKDARVSALLPDAPALASLHPRPPPSFS